MSVLFWTHSEKTFQNLNSAKFIQWHSLWRSGKRQFLIRRQDERASRCYNFANNILHITCREFRGTRKVIVSCQFLPDIDLPDRFALLKF